MLAPGDLLRQIDIPLAALKRRAAFRQISLTPVGRSAALVIGSLAQRRRADADGDGLDDAARSDLVCPKFPTTRELREAILQHIPDDALS